MKRITSTTWSPVRDTGSSSSFSCQRGYQPRPSRPGWPGAAWMACADKAHKVDGDGGAEACCSTPQTAGTSTLVALQPPLGAWYPPGARPRSWPSAAADSGGLHSKLTSKIYDPLLRHEVEGLRRLGNLGCHSGPSEPQRTSSGRRRASKSLLSQVWCKRRSDRLGRFSCIGPLAALWAP